MGRKVMLGVALVLAGACSYGMLAAFVKMAYSDGYTTTEIISSQFLIGAVALGILNIIFNKKNKERTSHPKKLRIFKLVLAGTPLGLTGLFYYFSLKYVPASMAIILLMQSIWLGVLLEAVLEKNRPSGKKIIATITTLTGTLLATNLLVEPGEIHLTGIMWGILAAITYTGTMYGTNRVSAEMSSLKRSFWMLIGGALVITVIGGPSLFINMDYSIFLTWGIVLAFFGAILPPILFNKGMPLTGIGLGTILAAAEIPVAVVMAAILLQEKVSALQWAGIGLIMASVVLMNINSTHTSAKQ